MAAAAVPSECIDLLTFGVNDERRAKKVGCLWTSAVIGTSRCRNIVRLLRSNAFLPLFFSLSPHRLFPFPFPSLTHPSSPSSFPVFTFPSLPPRLCALRRGCAVLVLSVRSGSEQCPPHPPSTPLLGRSPHPSWPPASHGGDGQQALPAAVQGAPRDGDVLHQFVRRERRRPRRPPPLLHIARDPPRLHARAAPHTGLPPREAEQLQSTPDRYTRLLWGLFLGELEGNWGLGKYIVRSNNTVKTQ